MPSGTDAAEPVRLDREESFALHLWATRVRDGECAAAGPALPPGWRCDVDDPVLLSYDPYFRSHTAQADAAAAPLIDASDERHYAAAALPICRTSAHSMRSLPPRASFVSGRLIAQRHIRAGEAIAMDVAALSAVEDVLVWQYPPPPAGQRVGAKSMPSHGQRGAGDKKNSTEAFAQDAAAAAAARHIVMRAYALRGGPAALIATGYAQLLASLLLMHGDMCLLPSAVDLDAALGASANANTGATSSVGVWMSPALLRSRRAEALVAQWADTDSGENDMHTKNTNTTNKDNEDVDEKGEDIQSANVSVARLLLLCVPPLLLSSDTRDAAEVRGGCISFIAQEPRAVVVPHCGFFRRMGLHIPTRLAFFLTTFTRYAVPVHVPDLPLRRACFPFLRRVPHACRPNTFVMFLDSPASHCYGAAGRFEHNTAAAKSAPPTPWGMDCTDRIFRPSVAVLVACRDMGPGEDITRALFPSVYTPQPERARISARLFGAPCGCRWCVGEPDAARAFRCAQCPPNCGVVCPRGDGDCAEAWECMQCGHRPGAEEVHRMQDEERELRGVKADKATGLARLLGAKRVHYSHAVVFWKIDAWCQRAWTECDARMCLEYLDVMQKSIDRVLDPCDPQRAQIHEFTAQVNHAVGSAHTARYEYFLALQIRLRAGMRYAHWCRKTWFMAAVKPLAEFLDSV